MIRSVSTQSNQAFVDRAVHQLFEKKFSAYEKIFWGCVLGGLAVYALVKWTWSAHPKD